MQPSRTKVLFISHSPLFGGAERCLYYLLKGLHREKFDLSAILPPRPLIHRSNQRNLYKLVEELGIPARLSPIRWWVGRWPRFRAFADGLGRRVAGIVRIMEQNRFDLAVSNTCAFAEGALAAKYCGIPHVWYVHEMLSADPALRSFVPLQDLYRIMDALSTRIVAVSEAVKRELAPCVDKEKLQVVLTGLPENEPVSPDRREKITLDIPPRAPVISFVGLLSERKGVMDFVAGAPAVLKRFPQAIFILAGGDGGKGREAAEKINEYKIRDSFRILGNRGDVAAILSASDMLVLPSLADPMPLAVLEAMSAGIPVVATRSGGSEEMVEDGVTGRLVPVKNPDALAEAIVELLSAPSLRVFMGLNASRRFAERFSFSRYITDFENVLDQTLAVNSQSAINHGDPAYVNRLVAQLESAAARQAGIISAQTTGLKKITSTIEASIRRWSLL